MFKHVCSILNESLLSLASLKRFMVGEQGWGARDGAVGGALASYQYGLGSNPRVDTICGLRFLLVPRGFSLVTPVFPSPQKPTLPNSNSTRNQVDKEPLCGCATSKSLCIDLFIIVAKKDKQVNNVLCIII